MAEWRRCLRRLPAQLRRAKKGTPAALKYKGRDENRALFICVPMIGGRRRSFASVDISSPLDAERQGEDLRRIVRVVVVRQAMTTLIDGKGFTDDAGKTLFSYAHRFVKRYTCRAPFCCTFLLMTLWAVRAERNNRLKFSALQDAPAQPYNF
jgi:hypothetical protein